MIGREERERGRRREEEKRGDSGEEVVSEGE